MHNLSKYLFISLVSTTLFARASTEVPATAKEPVYIYLYASVTDHVNLDITEDRLRRLLPMLERYQKVHPTAHVSATVLFSGSASQALAERNAKTHIVDFVKEYIQKGVIEPGYDGRDEPTYASRPFVDFTKITNPQDRWEARQSTERQFLTEGRDPLTGAPRPGTTGGLKKMQEVFGEAASITGLALPMKVGPGMPSYAVTKARGPGNLAPKEPVVPDGTNLEVGGDTEAVVNLRNMNSKAIIFGIPDTNPAHIPGFREARSGFSRLVSPIAETAPELYWQDHVLRSSEASSDVVRLVHAYAGPAVIQKLVEKIDRDKVHVVHVELADEQNYVRPEFVKGPGFPALRYAYDHPNAPQLPADALLPKDQVDQAFANEEALLKWAVEDFLSPDPGSRFISSSDLARMADQGTGFRVSMDAFRSALADFMKIWGDDTFAPPIFRADGRYLSRAEMFQVMADAMAEFHRTGKLPEAVEVVPVFGPVRVLTGHGPNEGQVSVETVARICADIAPALHDRSSSPIPKNAVPIGIPVEGAMLNPAQFLRLMALALMNPSPDAKLNIRMTYEFTAVGMLMPRTRPDMDDGFVWTLKPAPLESKLEARMAP